MLANFFKRHTRLAMEVSVPGWVGPNVCVLASSGRTPNYSQTSVWLGGCTPNPKNGAVYKKDDPHDDTPDTCHL